MPVDPHAARGFGSGADAYDRHRPGWPPEAVERALAELELGPQATVVDLAAGTGKLTRELVPRVARVVAVEPSADMRRQLCEVVAGVEALDGTADALPLHDASVDGVLVAEAFHWFATPATAAEMARVVRPGGGVALMWNLYHSSEDELWAERLAPVVGKHLPEALSNVARNDPDRWQPAFAGSRFGPFECFEVAHELHADVDGLVQLIGTWSYARALDEAARAEMSRELGEMLRRELPDPDDVVLRFRAQVHWARRAGG